MLDIKRLPNIIGNTVDGIERRAACLLCINYIAIVNLDHLKLVVDGVAIIVWLLAGDGAIIDKGTEIIFYDRTVVGQRHVLRHG